jgi:hypothetical protein
VLYMTQPDTPFTIPETTVDEDETRRVVRAGEVIRTDPNWVRRMCPEMLGEDGVLQLDSAGVWRFRESQDPRLRRLAEPFTAYERIRR